ncbi:MAG: M56 family metallopeptidase [Oscillospiraceae bacterium]|nr:M56 family metallopeptidase [Oscillospiraceae bacterium]
MTGVFTDFLSGLVVITLTTGGLTALLLLLAPAAAKRFTPRWRYWVWLALALRLAVPVHFAVPNPPVAFTVPALAEQPAPRSEEMLEELDLPQETPVQPLPASAANGVYAGNIYTPILDTAKVTVVEGGQVKTDWTKQVIQWPGLLFLLWCVGAAVTLGRELLRHWAFLRLCRRWRRPAEPELQAESDRRAKELGLDAAPRLYRCAAISTPMVAGLFHPVVLLPLDGTDVLMALDHELTHLKRKDLWYKALLLWVRTLHWFNPLVRLMCRRAESDLEQCCDYDLLQGRTLADRKAYGAALLDQMAAGCSGTRLTTGFSGGKREVMARFKALLDTSAKKKGGIALTLVVLAVALAGVAVGCYGAPGYDRNAQQYRNPKWNIQMDVPQELWDQLEVVEKTSGGVRHLYFVSRALKEALPDFDLSEDYWVILYGGKKNQDSYAYGCNRLEAVRDRYEAAGASAEELEALERLYEGAHAAMYSVVAKGQHLEAYDGVFRCQYGALDFEVPIPESLWAQLFCIYGNTDEFYYVSLVSSKLAGAVEDFDPAEDYWLQARYWTGTDGERVRSVHYGTWNYRYEVPFLKDSSGEMFGQISLYAAAPDVYRSFVFHDSDGGSTEQLTGDAYDRNTETYINYDLKFQLNIPAEVYERLDIYYTTPYKYQIYDMQCIYFIDRRLAEGFDMGRAGKHPIRYLDENYPGALYLCVDTSHYPSGTQEPAAVFAEMPGERLISGTDLFPDAESIPVYRLDGTQIRSFHPDTYDRETALYTNYKLSFRLSIPNEIYDRLYIHTEDTQVAMVGTGETVYASTVYFLDRSLLDETKPDVEDQISRLILNRDVLLTVQEDPAGEALWVQGVRHWTGENRNLYWFGHWAVSQLSPLNGTDLREIVRRPGSAALDCPDGEYRATKSSVQYYADENALLFLPLSEGTGQDACILPLAEDAVLTPMGNVPEGVEVTPDYVLSSMVVPAWSSYIPTLAITVKNGEITALAVK